jgi:hypothetical protein
VVTDRPTTPEAARADAGWLALREPADAAARSQELVDALHDRLPRDRPLVVQDLGAGTGSMARWLAPRLDVPQRWVLHDRDAELLPLAVATPPRTADGRCVPVEARCGDVTRLPPAELAGSALVTASALLDMMTAAELARFVAVCVGAGCPVLVALSVTGDVELDPGDPLDAEVRKAFNDHQRRRVGGSRLLGPGAVDEAVARFAAFRYDVVVRPSPWRLDGHPALTRQWFDGWLDAALGQRPELAPATVRYAARRRAEGAGGRLRVTVGHQDLLALPP